MSKENWMPIVGYEGVYEVSDCGRVRSLDHMVTHPTKGGGVCSRLVSGRDRKLRIYKGYALVNLGPESRPRLVHRLVAYAFLGPPPFGKTHINHKDGIKSNNCVENLEWVSPSENAIHASRTIRKLPISPVCGTSEGKIVGYWFPSQAEAAEFVGLKWRQNLAQSIDGGWLCKGYRFQRCANALAKEWGG